MLKVLASLCFPAHWKVLFRTLSLIPVLGLPFLAASAQSRVPNPIFRIVYERQHSIPFAMDAPTYRNIYSITTDGGAEQQLTSDNHSFSPALSPDGSRIAYIHITPRSCEGCLWPAEYELSVMNADGSDPRSLASLGNQYPWIRWSPDGKTLSALNGIDASEEKLPHRDKSLFLFHTDSGAPPELLAKNAMIGYEWSPDGRWIAYPCLVSQETAHRRFSLCVVEANGKSASRVLAEDVSPIIHSWSPDSSQLVYTSVIRKEIRLFVVAVDGSSAKLLTELSSPSLLISNPQWSPDGKQIVFSNSGRGKSSIWMVDPHGSDRHRPIEPKLQASGPLWSPDGKQIVFSALVHGWDQVHLMNSDGTGLRQITHEKNMGCLITKWLPQSTLLLLSCGYFKSLYADKEPVDRRLCVLDLNDPRGIPRELLKNFHTGVSVAPTPQPSPLADTPATPE